MDKMNCWIPLWVTTSRLLNSDSPIELFSEEAADLCQHHYTETKREEPTKGSSPKAADEVRRRARPGRRRDDLEVDPQAELHLALQGTKSRVGDLA